MGAEGGERRTAPCDALSRRPRTPDPVVRSAVEQDAVAVANLHAGQIGDGFLSFLGPRFLTRLYRRIQLSPACFLHVADNGGKVVGFIAGSGDVGGLYRRFLWHDGLGAAVATAPRLLHRWRQAFETLAHGSPSGAGTGRGVELLAVAVDPAGQGTGIGTRLVASFLAEVASGPEHAAYVVVASNNAVAIGLYERAGFARAAELELHAGTTSLLMQWDGPLPAPPAQRPG